MSTIGQYFQRPLKKTRMNNKFARLIQNRTPTDLDIEEEKLFQEIKRRISFLPEEKMTFLKEGFEFITRSVNSLRVDANNIIGAYQTLSYFEKVDSKYDTAQGKEIFTPSLTDPGSIYATTLQNLDVHVENLKRNIRTIDWNIFDFYKNIVTTQQFGNFMSTTQLEELLQKLDIIFNQFLDYILYPMHVQEHLLLQKLKQKIYERTLIVQKTHPQRIIQTKRTTGLTDLKDFYKTIEFYTYLEDLKKEEHFFSYIIFTKKPIPENQRAFNRERNELVQRRIVNLKIEKIPFLSMFFGESRTNKIQLNLKKKKSFIIFKKNPREIFKYKI